MRDEGIGIRFEADLAPLIKSNVLTDKLVDKWTVINKQLAKSGDTTGFSRGMARANTEMKRNADLADRNYRKINEDLHKTGNSADGYGDKVSEAQRKIRLQTDKTTTSFGRLKDVGSRFANMGNTIALAMLPVAAAFKKSADEATQLENKYKTIQNLLHTGGESASASKAQSRAMEKENNNFALQYGVSPTAMAKGGEELIRRGYSGNQELASHKYFLQAARASGDPYSAVVGYGAPALEQFGYKKAAGSSRKKMADYSKLVLNQMAYGADLSATDFSGIGNALRYAGATAHSGNQSLSGTIADIGVLSNNGMDGSVAGTSLRKDINSLLSPNKGPMGQGEAALNSIGLHDKDLRDSKNNLMSLDNIFQLLNKHMRGMTDTQKAAVFHGLFGATGQEAALILSKNVDQMKSLNKQVAKAPKYGKNGYIADLAKKNMSSWQNQIDVFKQHLNIMGLDFTKLVLPGFTKLLTIGNKFLNILIKMPTPVKRVVSYTTAIASALAAAYVSSKLLTKGTHWLLGSNGEKGSTTVGNTAADIAENSVGGLSRSGSTHYTSSLANLPSKLNNATSIHTGIGKMAAVGTGLSIGVSAVSAIHDGLDSKKGGREMWSAGGQAAGAGIGLALSGGNPVVAAIGASIGGSIGTAFADSPAVKQLGNYLKKLDKIESNNQSTSDHGNNHTYGNHTQQAQYGQNVQHTKSRRGLTDVYSTGLTTGDNTHKSKRGPHKVTLSDNIASMQAASNANFKKMAGDSWGFISKSLSLEKKANSEWASSTSKSYSAVSGTYRKLDSLAQKYAGKQEAKSKKNLSYLEKNGLLTKSQAQNDYKTTKGYYSKRLSALHSNINSLINDDKSGGKKRIADIQRVNAEILSLTDKGGQKQKTLLSQLNSRTRRLTVAGYGKIISESDHAYKKTTSNAKKQYNTEVTSANDRYKKAVSIAKSTKGLSASQRATIISNAKKQKNSSVANAKTQYSGTLKWARQQRRDVVKQAQIEAGSAKDAFSKAAKDVGNSIPALITQNLKLGLSTANPKFHSGDLTNNIAKNNGKTNAGSTAGGKRPKNSIYNGSDLAKFATHANGGKISRTQTALVGEGGPELAYTVRGKNVRLLGVNGPQMARLKPGEHILNAMSTRRVLAGNYGQSLPGYANGTNGISTRGTSNSLGKLGSKSKQTWSKTYNDTAKSTNKIKKNTIKDYDATQKGSVFQLSQLSKQNKSYWSNIHNKTGNYTNSIRKNSIKDFDSMQKGVQVQMVQVRKGVTNAADDTATGFGHALGRMDNYAHKAMSNTINQLNNGIKGIDKSLGQFGGNNSVINPIHYAQGSNGQLSEDQIAMVNDATSGPRQEGIIRGGQLYAPKGNNRVVGLQRGDAVLNGTQMQRLTRANGITHYAKGSGVSNAFLKKLINSSAKDPSGWLKKNMTVNIKLHGTDLSKGATNTTKGAYGKYGNPWADEVWKQMKDARNGGGSGAGGNWAHTPGLPEYNGFNARRGRGLHDGVDFAGPIGSAFRAVHGGTVTRTGGSNPWNDFKDLGNIITVKSSDGFQEIYQEFGNAGNIKVHTGDQIKTGQVLGTLGHLAGHDVHVHVGVSKGSLWNHGGYSHNGWYDVTKMHGHSSGNAKGKNTKHSSALSKLVAKELAPQLKWVGKHLEDSNVEAGGAGNIGGAGVNRWIPLIKKSAKAMHVDLTSDRLKRVLNTMTHESQGDPTVWQHGYTDINTNRDPARGLFQFIGTTFKRYALKGHTNRANGYDQILALFNDSNLWSDLRWNGGWAPSGNRRFAKGGIPQTNKASIVGEKGAELFMPNVSGRVFTAKDTAVMATNMMKASLSVGKMLRELERVIKKPAVSAASYRHVAKTEPTFHIETHDKFEFNIGTGVELNERTITKMIKNALKRERQNMARQIIDQFGGTK